MSQDSRIVVRAPIDVRQKEKFEVLLYLDLNSLMWKDLRVAQSATATILGCLIVCGCIVEGCNKKKPYSLNICSNYTVF